MLTTSNKLDFVVPLVFKPVGITIQLSIKVNYLTKVWGLHFAIHISNMNQSYEYPSVLAGKYCAGLPARKTYFRTIILYIPVKIPPECKIK